MKFQLKRSDQLTQGGTALTPDGQYLEFGEIAINYNATDPAIFFKDTQNNVIRLSGVNAQIGSGDITLTAGSGISISNPNSFNLQDSYDTNITISVNQGTGSGLDADTVDGIHAASFLRSDTNDTYSGLITGNQLHLGGSQITNSSAKLQVNGFSRQGTIYLHDLTNGVDSPLKNVNGELIWNTDVIWHAGNDGPGSGLDADLLDGQHASSFIRSDANDTATGEISFTSGVQISGAFSGDTQQSELVITGASPTITFNDTSSTTPPGADLPIPHDDFYIHVANNNFYVLSDRDGTAGGWDTPHPLQLESDTNRAYTFGNRILTVADEGSGNGLDADLLDGQHGSYYRNASNLNAGTIPDARIPDTITPLTLVQTVEVRGNGTQLVLNAGEAAGKFSGQTGEYIYTNAERGLLISTSGGNNNFQSGWYPRQTLINGEGIHFYYSNLSSSGSHTKVGEITTTDSTWLRINQNTAKNIYTPRYIRADGGFFVDGTSKGVNGSGNFIGGTIAGASDYGTLLRSNASDQYDGQTSGRVMRFRCVDGRNAGSSSGSLFPLEIYQNSNTTNSDAAMTFHIAGRYAAYFGLDRQTNDLFFGGWSRGAAKYKVWHAANDGSGSGLDADTVDGIQGGSFLRSDANDTATGAITFNGRVSIRGHIDLSDGENLDFGSSDDVRVNYNSNNWLYWDFRSGNGIVYRDNGSDKIILEDSGIIRPAATNTGTIGTSSRYWDNGYFQDFNISSNLTVQNRIYVGSSDNGHAIEVDRSSSYDAHLYIGGWSSSNSNNIARIRCSTNLHIDSPADGHTYFNWYSKKNINYKGPLLGGDSTSTCRPTNGSESGPGLSFQGDSDTGFYRGASNRINITTGGAYRGFMAGSDFRFAGIYSATTGGGTNVRVDSNGRLRRHSSSRRTKTNIEPMEVEYAYKILDEVEPIWYRPRVPDPQWPQAYLENLAEDEAHVYLTAKLTAKTTRSTGRLATSG